MYGIPEDIDLSAAIGDITTQIRVGPFDLQFEIGHVCFAIQSLVRLFRDGQLYASWNEGRWPDTGFYDVLNIEVKDWRVEEHKTIIIVFENGVEMHLEDTSEQYESMQIAVEAHSGNPAIGWII